MDPLAGPRPLVIHDVGLGIAANAIAAIHCFNLLQREGGNPRPLVIESFENDLEGIATALREGQEAFPFLKPFSMTLDSLFKERSWVSPDGAIRWNWHEGDYRKTITRSLRPDLVFYDFYAPKSCPELWSLETFTLVHGFLASTPGSTRHSESGGSDAVLVTYSAATPVRSAMLRAGFYVGHGSPTQAKQETTVAALRKESLAQPLGSRWLSRLGRSHSVCPDELPQILKHPQFAAQP